MGEQLQIQPTTTLPAAKPIVPSIAALVKAQKSIPQMAEILGIDEPEVQVRLEAAGLLEIVMKYPTHAAHVVEQAPTQTEGYQAAIASAGTTPAQVPVQTTAELPKPAITDVLPEKPTEFVRKRGRSAAAPQPPQQIAQQIAQVQTQAAPLDSNARMTKAEAAYHGHPPMPLDDDQLALALGKLTLVARKVGVPVDQLLAWCRTVINSESPT